MKPAYSINVIGSKGFLRSRELQKWLLIQEDLEIVRYRAPYFPNESEYKRSNDLAKLHYGADIALGEAGCSLAHYFAQRDSFLAEDKLAMFLEDDAIPPSISWRLPRPLSKLLESNLPIGVTLFNAHYETDHIALSTKKNEFESLGLRRFKAGSHPWGTVAYLLNRPALRLAMEFSDTSSQSPVGKADFPVWASAIRWYVVGESAFGHLSGETLIPDRRDAPLGLGLLGQIRLVISRFLSLQNTIPAAGLFTALKWEFWEFFYRIMKVLKL